MIANSVLRFLWNPYCLPLAGSNRSMSKDLKQYHAPNYWTRRALVWSGQYKNSSEIPETITTGQMSKARGHLRIRLGTGLMIAILMGCYFIVKMSKRELEQEKWNRGLYKSQEEK